MEIVQWILVIALIAWAVWNGYRQHRFYHWADKSATEIRNAFDKIGAGKVPSGPTGLP
jgi:hypothetical protein